MKYRKCGRSGVFLPEISLGLWHNFGEVNDYAEARRMILTAFSKGVCHFDLANNYGPPPGSAEGTFGRVLREDLAAHRDEMFISSKAGHDMWPGVYGTGSSRKNLIASCDASLRRTGLDYFDVFYSHRYDGVTPVEETMQALIDIVRSGKALYAGISKYPPEQQKLACDILREAKVPCLLSQYRASMFDRKAIEENFDVAVEAGSGIICFSPLAQGLLTDKYLNGIPADSRAANKDGFLKITDVTHEKVEAARMLNDIAASRGQTLAQMAVAWLLADRRVTSVIIGASSVRQLESNLAAIDSPEFTSGQLDEIRRIIEPSLL
ncbi:MAG: aldo/keto reductase [Duncaniella sp.]|uniref:aldo/keto reductase n=1 Tax=Duncaniella sp. TaxID=2518496 RepID=UPI0023CF8CD4|nr:aldo/keto reductase [Duncaniella sp.]MDE6090604.1 aldo/keto reductase [Duncaniella sp.]